MNIPLMSHMIAFPTVVCDVCRKPVEYMETHDDLSTGDRVLRVACHGQWDEMRLSVADMMELGEHGLHQLNHGVGHAFRQSMIESSKEKAPDLSTRG